MLSYCGQPNALHFSQHLFHKVSIQDWLKLKVHQTCSRSRVTPTGHSHSKKHYPIGVTSCQTTSA
ncbi:hypothetical protein PGTUg99_031720 [Puccinia graminis f. sp. tritici]|nr:hypothetical protein PGTUg99_031720 [Puccinia graminis f. sp. tritici]